MLTVFLAIVTWMFIIIEDSPRVGYLTRLDTFMNLSFAVVFAMSVAHSVNYVLYEMQTAEFKKQKRASIAALHTTLAKLASHADRGPMVVERYAPSAEAPAPAPRRPSITTAMGGMVRMLSRGPVAATPAGATKARKSFGTEGGASRAGEDESPSRTGAAPAGAPRPAWAGTGSMSSPPTGAGPAAGAGTAGATGTEPTGDDALVPPPGIRRGPSGAPGPIHIHDANGADDGVISPPLTIGSDGALLSASPVLRGTAKVAPEPLSDLGSPVSPLSSPAAAALAAQNELAAEQRGCCGTCNCSCSCGFVGRAWRKTTITRKVDIVITALSACTYVAGCVWIFSMPRTVLAS